MKSHFLALLLAVLALVAVAPAQSGNPPLSNERLRTMLVGLGGDVSEVPAEGETQAKIYRTKWTDDTWTFVADCTISPNGQVLWLTLRLKEIEPTKISRELLLEMLAENNDTTRPYFGYLKSSKQIVLTVRLESSLVNEKLLRESLDRMGSMARRTQKLWDPEFKDGSR